MKNIARVVIIASAGLLISANAGLADSTSRPKYGCFKVTADSLNIRARPYASSKVIGAASKGDILIKRYRFCTPRGFWCAVTHGDLKGYADKKFMKKTACPASMSK